MSISYLPTAVLGLTLGWLDLPDAAIATRTTKAWLSAARNGRFTNGALCLISQQRSCMSDAELERYELQLKRARPWRQYLELILSSFWRRHIGELCIPWEAELSDPGDLSWLPRIAAGMPQLDRLTVTIAADLLPLPRLELPAQLRELRLQILLNPNQRREYFTQDGTSPSVFCCKVRQRVTDTLRLVADSAPQLRAFTLHLPASRIYFSLWPSACGEILRLKQLERLYILLMPSYALSNPPLAAMLTRFGSEMPRLRTLITKPAEWDFQQTWRSCPKEPSGGTPLWTAETLALLTAGPRNQCVLEYIGKFAADVTEQQYEELRRAIPTLKQPLRS